MVPERQVEPKWKNLSIYVTVDFYLKCPLQLLHLSPAYFSPQSIVGGGERYVFNIIEAAQTAAETHGINLQQRLVAIGHKKEEHWIDSLKINVLPNISPFDGAMQAYSDELWDEVVGADVVHIYQSLTRFGEYAIAVVASYGIPVVATDLGGGDSSLMLKSKGIQLADAVLSISDFSRKLVEPYYQGLHRVLIGPVDTTRFCPSNSARRSGLLNVLCVSRIMPHKGIDRIIHALPSGMKLTVLGRVYDESYFSLLQEIAVEKDVVFLTAASDEDLLMQYQQATVLVQASTHQDIYGNYYAKPELMGLTTLEALACGVPVIVSDAGSLPELAVDSRYSAIFTSTDQLKSLLEQVQDGLWPVSNASELARAQSIAHHSKLAIGEQ